MQRRHQKVIEECPAPDLPDDVRAALADHALALLAPSCYRSAGTVEFVVDADRLDMAFLEVNTRLQVEHGVTELVYGVDLVEWMVRLAAGEDLDKFAPSASVGLAGGSAAPSAGGSTIRPIRGHAVEARVYAEDPLEQYRPSAGLVTEASWPDDRGVRVDTWVGPGTEVTSWYDPLLGKVLASAPSRSEAMAALQRAAGVSTDLLDIGEGPGEPAEAVVPSGQVPVRSPVTGAVWKVLVQVGAQVEAGDPVASIEAMKMETIVRAPAAGRITQILVQESVVVDAGRALALIAP